MQCHYLNKKKKRLYVFDDVTIACLKISDKSSGRQVKKIAQLLFMMHIHLNFHA